MMHSGIKVQFELDMEHGPAALMCKQCHRSENPNTKFPDRLPPKSHPPKACGMTIFGGNNSPHEAQALAAQHNASLVILLRKNHVAHAISAYRHFTRVPRGASRKDLAVPWTFDELSKNAEDKRSGYNKLVSFAGAQRPTHLIFYEDLKARPSEVWDRLQAFLGLPRQELPDIGALEAKSTSKPSIEYLSRLGEIQAQAAGTEWAGMLSDDGFDERLDLDGEFAAICARFPRAALSWRRHACVDGKALPAVAAVGVTAAVSR
jgi:hypothetical protein